MFEVNLVLTMKYFKHIFTTYLFRELKLNTTMQKYFDWFANVLPDVTNLRIQYFELDHSAVILPPTVHEQEDGVIFAVCATGTSSKDSLLSWIRCLEKDHPVLEKIPIVFTLKKSTEEKLYIEDTDEQQIQRLQEKNDNSTIPER